MPWPRSRILAVAVPALVLVAGLLGYAETRYEKSEVIEKAETITGGSAERGKKAFSSYGCGGCHTLKGVPQAAGLVGPPLDGIGARAIIGGRLDNTPDNLKRWIRDPQAVSPGTAMPRLGVTERDAKDISALLYTSA